MLATAGDDVRIWDADSLQLQHHFFLGSFSNVGSVSWSSDGRHLVAAPKYSNVIRVTELTTESPVQQQFNVGRPVTCAEFSQWKERLLVVGCMDGSVLLWDKNMAKSTGIYQAHSSSVNCMSFSNNDSIIATGSSDGSVAIYKVMTKQPSGSLTEATGKLVTAVQFSTLSRYQLVSSHADGAVCFWDGASQKMVGRTTLHPDVCCTDVALSPVNVSLLASVGVDKRITFFDLSTSKVQGGTVSPEPLESVEFLEDGQRLLVGGSSGKLHLYDLRMASQPLQKTLMAHAAPVTCIRLCQQAAGLKKGTGAGVATQRISSRFAEIALTEVPAGRLPSPQLSPFGPGSVTDGRHSGTADDSVGSVDSSAPDSVSNVTQESIGSMIGPDWLCMSGHKNRRAFRLSDVLPFLPDTAQISPSVNVVEVCSDKPAPKSAEVPQAKLFVEGAEETRPRASSPIPEGVSAQPQHPEDASQAEASAGEGCGDTRPPQETQPLATPCLSGFQEGHLRKLVAEEVGDLVDRLHAHIRHIDTELMLDLFRIRKDMNTKLQRIADDILALRRDVSALADI